MSREDNKSKRERRGFLEYLAVKGDLSADGLLGDIHIELRGRNTLYMQGCRRILKYSSEEMVLAAKNLAVSVLGERLVCSSFHGGMICVNGLITSINMTEEKEGGV